MTPATAIKIAAATRFHVPALAEIHRLAFPHAEVWNAAALATQLATPCGFGFVAEAGGFALARIIVDEAELLTLAVVPAQRRRGIGAALLAAVAGEAFHRGASSLFLEVADRNQAGRALYSRFGFVPVGRRAAYYPDGADALVMRRCRELTPAAAPG